MADKPVAPICTPWRHSGASVTNVPSVQIKSVPEDVHAELRRRAANEGKSLQEYLLGRLIEEARRPSLDDLLSRAGHRSGGRVSFRFASEAVREDRDAG
jgi:plasmid stability protein